MVRLGHHFANTRRLQQTLHQPRPASIRVMASPSRQLVLSDAHAHPQEDTQHLGLVQSLQAREVAVMGVSAVTDDWDKVLRLKQLAPQRVIPCFGVHPWSAHLHAGEQLLDCEEGEEEGSALQQEGPSSRSSSSAGHNGGAAPDMGHSNGQLRVCDMPSPMLDIPPQQAQEEKIQALLNSTPDRTWLARLRRLLRQHPGACVGEFGLDRSAVIPGTKARVALEHQLRIARAHMAVAAEFQRPVSLHCVRATGPMQDLLSTAPADQLPPRIMLHSYGGSPESIVQLIKLPGVGGRLWFSFSSAINARGGEEGAAKLLGRIRAVPDDRLLIESDQSTPRLIDSGLASILSLVAQAKGWSQEEAAHIVQSNFEAFFSGFRAADS